ncbi:MAG: hypothetical protein O2822_04060 [Chloroflexi bacterium]|nr:hypothetical protein [Chloroflexota bacterium]
MSSMRFTGRKTVMASLLALGLLVSSALLGTSTLGSSASAGEPGAVFHGFVVPEQGTPLAQRIRAVSESGVVCGSAEVAPLGAGEVGFYAMSVYSSDMRDGCPDAGESVRFVLVYGRIDEGVLVGQPTPFQSGTVSEFHLIRPSTDARLALP